MNRSVGVENSLSCDLVNASPIQLLPFSLRSIPRAHLIDRLSGTAYNPIQSTELVSSCIVFLPSCSDICTTSQLHTDPLGTIIC